MVSRAFRLILEGALNDGNVDQLAERLGIGSRHLRRLFVQHLGASPVKIATTQRVHLARGLCVNLAGDHLNQPARDLASRDL